MSNKDKRCEQIMTILEENGSVEITKIAQILGVTPMTIRRDLSILRNKYKVKVYHGVAILTHKKELYPQGYLLSQAESLRLEEKKRIARRAASLVEGGDILILDAGSTTALVPTFIQKDISVKIICFSLNAFLNCLGRNNMEIILAGGIYHETSRVFESDESVHLMERYRANKVFISASGVREDLGVTCSNIFEIPMKQSAMRSSMHRILLADSSKFGKISSCFFSNIDEFDMIITDSSIDESIVRSLKSKNITVELV